MEEQEKFYVTFGVKYKQEAHSRLTPEQCNPDGWLEVFAADYTLAREGVVKLIGPEFAFMYNEEDFKLHYHPDGPNAVLYVVREDDGTVNTSLIDV